MISALECDTFEKARQWQIEWEQERLKARQTKPSDSVRVHDLHSDTTESSRDSVIAKGRTKAEIINKEEQDE